MSICANGCTSDPYDVMGSERLRENRLGLYVFVQEE